MRFDVIVADPPWAFSDKLQMGTTARSASDNYDTLTLDDIAALPVSSVAEPSGCLLALWTPSCMLVDGLMVMQRWGFELKGTYVWTKMRRDMLQPAIGMGHLFRQSHELAIIGVMGKPLRTIRDRGQRSACLDINRGHSIKPEALQDSLDLMWPDGCKLELFARRYRPGWTCVGNELDELDIREVLPLLAAAPQVCQPAPEGVCLDNGCSDDR